MTLEQGIQHLEGKLQQDSFQCEECRKEHVELLEWLEELRESRKVIRAIQEQLLNSQVSPLCEGRMGTSCD